MVYLRSLQSIFLVVAMSSGALAQPPNDEPCSAITIAVLPACSPFTSTNVEATDSPQLPLPGCANYTGADVWFSFTAPADGIATITMYPGTLTDGGMAVYGAVDCGSTFALLACDDDAGPGQMPLLEFSTLLPGNTYWVRTFGYGNNTGTFTICATGTPPVPNGDCAYSLDLYDSFGDGWNGAEVSLSVNGGPASSYTCSASSASITFGLDLDDVLSVTYTAGSLNSENSFAIRHLPTGPVAYYSGTDPEEGTVFTLINTCIPAAFEPMDCMYHIPVCSDTSIVTPAGGAGSIVDLTPANQGCLAAGERQGAWLSFRTATSGTLGFTLTPQIQPTDIDFALWGSSAGIVCPPSTQPVRCSWAALAGATGLLASATDVSEAAGGDRFVDTLHVLADERYVLYVDNFSFNGLAVDLTFQLSDGLTLACDELTVDLAASSNTTLVNVPVDFTDLSTGDPYFWAWYFPGALDEHAFEQDPTNITYDLPGCYDVELTAISGAGEGSTTRICEVEVSTTTAVNQHSKDRYIVQYDDGSLVIIGSGAPASVYVFDASGRMIDSFVIRSGRSTHPSREYLPGIYTLTVADDAGVYTQRVCIVP